MAEVARQVAAGLSATVQSSGHAETSGHAGTDGQAGQATGGHDDERHPDDIRPILRAFQIRLARIAICRIAFFV